MKKFGLLQYRTANLGDDIQLLAARKLMSSVDFRVDREKLHECTHAGKIILNGWFMHRPENWPPAEPLTPLLISMHLSAWKTDSTVPAQTMLGQENLAYWKRHAPIGARDLYTLDLFRTHGIDAYFSGCLTLTLPEREPQHAGSKIFVSDLDPFVLSALRTRTKHTIEKRTHELPADHSPDSRESLAQNLLDEYQSAKYVVTSRLHAALPCLAMGVPVLYITQHKDQSRFRGYESLVRHCTRDEFLRSEINFDFNDPTPNSSDYQKLRSTLEAKVKTFLAP